MKKKHEKTKTLLSVNKGIQGEAIEITIERLMEGEGEEGVESRDLVYNDNETGVVNPITNIRSDKMELMLEEKIGEYEHNHRKIKTEDIKTEDVQTEDVKTSE